MCLCSSACGLCLLLLCWVTVWVASGSPHAAAAAAASVEDRWQLVNCCFGCELVADVVAAVAQQIVVHALLLVCCAVSLLQSVLSLST